MFLITAKQHFLNFIEAKWSLVCHVLNKSALQHTPGPRRYSGKSRITTCTSTQKHVITLWNQASCWWLTQTRPQTHTSAARDLSGILISSSWEQWGSVRYAGEAANAPGGREEEVAESDTTTWSQWGYRRLMIKAKGVHGRQTHVCVEKTHGTARVGAFSFPKNLNWSFAVKKDAGLGFFFWDEHTQLSE